MRSHMLGWGTAFVAALALSFAALSPEANAYEIRLETTSATTVQVGDIVTFDAFLDTQGESDIWGIQLGLGFDDSIFMYRPDLSAAEDFVLYSPAGGKGDPARYLSPTSDPFDFWNGNPWIDPRRIQLVFLSNNGGNPNWSQIGTTATATNAYLGTLSFEAVSTGTSDFSWRFDDFYGDAFVLVDVPNEQLITVHPDVATPGGGVWTVVPEPATALLVGIGLATLAASRPRPTSEPTRRPQA